MKVKLNDFGQEHSRLFGDRVHEVKFIGDTYFEFEEHSGKFPKINFEVIK